MAKRYVIWDKECDVITPIGEALTPEQWIARRPIAGIVTTVVAGGTINGAFFGVYGEMVDAYEKLGCDFSACTTEQEHLDAIEAYEDALNKADAEGLDVDTSTRLANLEAENAQLKEDLETQAEVLDYLLMQ